jgi:transcriptional regulator with XRE-family HTH domain
VTSSQSKGIVTGGGVVQVRTLVELGALARAARAARGWNQQQAADAAGVSRRFVNMLEGGGHVNAEVWRVLALLEAVGVVLTATLPSESSTVPEDSLGTPAAATVAPDGFDLDSHLSAFRNDQGSS